MCSGPSEPQFSAIRVRRAPRRRGPGGGDGPAGHPTRAVGSRYSVHISPATAVPAADLFETAIAALMRSWQQTHPVALLAAAVAGVLIVVSAVVRTIIPLRWLAVGANAGFIVYGAMAPAPGVLALHLVLLPVNLVRVLQMLRLTQRVRQSAEQADLSGLWLRTYMKRRRMRAGKVIFRAGDIADHLYFLAEGEVEIVEKGLRMQPGRIFGEIAFFAPGKRRTSTARCATRCVVLSIDETTFRQLYHQNPDFGFEVVRLLAGRLTADIERLEARLAQAKSGATPAGPAA